MLTQSGVKPLTSINMSRRYVELFDKLKAGDAIVGIGYNFNIDDNHINGLFRQLIEEEGRHFFWIVPSGPTTNDRLTRSLEEKMRLPTSVRERIHIIRVDRETRKVADGKTWIEQILAELEEALAE